MLETKNTITVLKNVFDRLIGRLGVIEERNSEFNDMTIETSKAETEREKRLKKGEENIQELWNSHMRYNIHIMGISEEEGRERGTEKKF